MALTAPAAVEPAPLDPAATPAGPPPGDARENAAPAGRSGSGSGRRGDRANVVLFGATSFLASGLLFAVEPMVAKMLLPSLGGSPAVWNTALVFFQAALLVGYGLAHLSIGRLGLRRQPVLQALFAILPVALLPIALPHGWHAPAQANPVGWTLMVLAVMVGAPFVMLGTVSPALQRWFAASDHPTAANPYVLYALGNAGAFLALLAYPGLIEPTFDLTGQARLWTAGYVVFCCLLVACAVKARRWSSRPAGTEAAAVAQPPRPTTWIERGRWILFAAVPSALLLGVTRHISTDIAAIPLLWVIPLALYLLTFVVAFGIDARRPTAIAARAVKILAIPVALSLVGFESSIAWGIGLHLTTFTAIALMAHGRLALSRPEPVRLTEFYLWVSVGGVVGGILAALVAPVVFNTVLEYPIGLALGVALIPGASTAVKRLPRAVAVLGVAGFVALVLTAGLIRFADRPDALRMTIYTLAAASILAYALARRERTFGAAMAIVIGVAVLAVPNTTMRQDRSFFGVYQVLTGPEHQHVFLSGTTDHGHQNFAGGPDDTPLSYYHRSGPIGQYFGAVAARTQGEPQSVAVVGLGAGAIASYGRSGDTFTFYEIDPTVVSIASDPHLFTFLADSPAKVRMVVGDGRLRLAATTDRYDTIVLDAFSSDAIPVHLLTRQALEIYLSRLRPHGVLAFHISNRYLDLRPVLGGLSHSLGLSARIEYDGTTPALAAAGKSSSTWVVMARSEADLRGLPAGKGWTPVGDGSGTALWTDEFSNVLDVFHLS